MREKCGASALVSLCHFRRVLPLISYTLNLKRNPFKLKGDFGGNLAWYSASFFQPAPKLAPTSSTNSCSRPPPCAPRHTTSRCPPPPPLVVEFRSVQFLGVWGRAAKMATSRVAAGQDQIHICVKLKLLKAAFLVHFLWQHAVRVITS